MKTETVQNTNINKEQVTRKILTDDILNLGNFINANKEEVGEINFILDLNIEECCYKSFI